MLVPGVHVGGSVFFRFLHRTHRMYRPDFTGSFLCRQYREPSRGLHGANFCLNQLISAPTYAHPVTWHSNASTEDVDAKDDALRFGRWRRHWDHAGIEDRRARSVNQKPT